MCFYYDKPLYVLSTKSVCVCVSEEIETCEMLNVPGAFLAFVYVCALVKENAKVKESEYSRLFLKRDAY